MVNSNEYYDMKECEHNNFGLVENSTPTIAAEQSLAEMI